MHAACMYWSKMQNPYWSKMRTLAGAQPVACSKPYSSSAQRRSHTGLGCASCSIALLQAQRLAHAATAHRPSPAHPGPLRLPGNPPTPPCEAAGRARRPGLDALDPLFPNPNPPSPKWQHLPAAPTPLRGQADGHVLPLAFHHCSTQFLFFHSACCRCARLHGRHGRCWRQAVRCFLLPAA